MNNSIKGLTEWLNPLWAAPSVPDPISPEATSSRWWGPDFWKPFLLIPERNIKVWIKLCCYWQKQSKYSKLTEIKGQKREKTCVWHKVKWVLAMNNMNNFEEAKRVWLHYNLGIIRPKLMGFRLEKAINICKRNYNNTL